MKSKDILLAENGNGGDIVIQNDDIVLTEQLYQQVYLCLFGGNVEASTKGNEIPSEIRWDWWGNSGLFSQDKPKQFNSETERALNENALNSVGRVNIYRAVETDLALFRSVAEISINVVILSYNKLVIEIKLTQPNNQQDLTLQIIWDNAKNEIIMERNI